MLGELGNSLDLRRGRLRLLNSRHDGRLECIGRLKESSGWSKREKVAPVIDQMPVLTRRNDLQKVSPSWTERESWGQYGLQHEVTVASSVIWVSLLPTSSPESPYPLMRGNVAKHGEAAWRSIHMSRLLDGRGGNSEAAGTFKRAASHGAGIRELGNDSR